MKNALDLFRMGNDYIQIGLSLDISEADVERQIHALRIEEQEKARKRENRRIYQRNWQRRNREDLAKVRAGA